MRGLESSLSHNLKLRRLQNLSMCVDCHVLGCGGMMCCCVASTIVFLCYPFLSLSLLFLFICSSSSFCYAGPFSFSSCFSLFLFSPFLSALFVIVLLSLRNFLSTLMPNCVSSITGSLIVSLTSCSVCQYGLYLGHCCRIYFLVCLHTPHGQSTGSEGTNLL